MLEKKKMFINYFIDWKKSVVQSHKKDYLISYPELWITFEWERDNDLTLYDEDGNWSSEYLKKLDQLEKTDPSLWLVISTMHARLLLGYYIDASVRGKPAMQELDLELADLFADAESFYITLTSSHERE